MNRLVLCASAALGALATLASPAGAEEKFGAGVTMKEVAPIERLMAAPETLGLQSAIPILLPASAFPWRDHPFGVTAARPEARSPEPEA